MRSSGSTGHHEGKVRGAGGPAEGAVEGWDAAAAAAPFVEVAHHEDRVAAAGARRGDGREQALRLLLALGAAQAEMRRDDAEHAVARRELGVDRAARLAAGDSGIDVADRENRKPRQDGVAEAAAAIGAQRARDQAKAGRLGEERLLVERALPVLPRADLLEADDVGAELAQHLGDSRGVVPAVDADAFVHVVGGDDEPAALGFRQAAARRRATADPPASPRCRGMPILHPHLPCNLPGHGSVSGSRQ
jgi:hypothetical protein